jgi:hypothetical protein
MGGLEECDVVGEDVLDGFCYEDLVVSLLLL